MPIHEGNDKKDGRATNLVMEWNGIKYAGQCVSCGDHLGRIVYHILQAGFQDLFAMCTLILKVNVNFIL